jgi:6-phosphofructokinase 1
MVDTLARYGVGMLFAIGGDGTFRGASVLAKELARREMNIPVVGVPKTIDNDIRWVERSFGFATAVEEAQRTLDAAHAEARGARNGVGLVKLMGRYAGLVAAHATLASGEVNCCLVPEVPFAMDGPRGLLSRLEERLALRSHAVVVVAEGAGQGLMSAGSPPVPDASGNPALADIGVFLRDAITRWFASRRIDVAVKYIDPSYLLRALPANAIDSEFCQLLGQHAVHAAMAGRTDVMVGYWNQRFTHVPLPLATRDRRQLDPDGELWQRVLESTGMGV